MIDFYFCYGRGLIPETPVSIPVCSLRNRQQHSEQTFVDRESGRPISFSPIANMQIDRIAERRGGAAVNESRIWQ